MRDDSRTKGNPGFDELRELYETSPDLFEKRRRELIGEVIASFPAARRRRARGWQFRLEASLRHYRDPVARMNKMSEILWQQLETLRQALNGDLPHPKRPPDHRTARVIDFSSRRDTRH